MQQTKYLLLCGELVLLAGLLLACGSASPTPLNVPSGALPATSPAISSASPTPSSTATPKPATARPTPTRIPPATPDLTPTALVRARLNQPVFTKDKLVITAKSTEFGKQFTKMVAANSSYTLLAVEIEVQNNAEASYNIATQRFVLRDSDNTVYEYKIYGKFPALHDGKGYLGQNEKVSGWLTYEIPEIASGLVLEYKTGAELIQIELD